MTSVAIKSNVHWFYCEPNLAKTIWNCFNQLAEIVIWIDSTFVLVNKRILKGPTVFFFFFFYNHKVFLFQLSDLLSNQLVDCKKGICKAQKQWSIPLYCSFNIMYFWNGMIHLFTKSTILVWSNLIKFICCEFNWNLSWFYCIPNYRIQYWIIYVHCTWDILTRS